MRAWAPRSASSKTFFQLGEFTLALHRFQLFPASVVSLGDDEVSERRAGDCGAHVDQESEPVDHRQASNRSPAEMAGQDVFGRFGRAIQVPRHILGGVDRMTGAEAFSDLLGEAPVIKISGLGENSHERIPHRWHDCLVGQGWSPPRQGWEGS